MRVPGIFIGNAVGNSSLPYWTTQSKASKAPSALYAEVISATSLTLTWTNNGVLNYTGHKIYISTDGTNYILKDTVTTIGTSKLITGLTAGTKYYFYVVAYKNNGESNPSNVISYQTSTRLTGLVTGWKFDEASGDAIDITGTYTLTNNNTATYVSGIINKAVSLGSGNTNKSLTIASNLGLAYDTPKTYAAWVKIVDIPAGTGDFTYALFSQVFGTNPGNYVCPKYRRQSNVLKLDLYTGQYTVTLAPGTWYHIIVTWDQVANVTKLYLNGVLRITSTGFTADYHTYPNSFAIGNITTSSSTYYSSHITDKLNIWNRILTDDEIAEEYGDGEGYPFPYYPKMAVASPAAGERVKATIAGWNAAIYHSLYLPSNYTTSRTWPIIIELPGNTNAFETGLPNGDIYMGWGLSEGRDFIWSLCPFINTDKTAMAPTWWGDGSSPTTQSIDSTVDYLNALIADLIANYHGDATKIVLMGWSRGAIACGYIGCSSDVLANKFISWMPHSHHDGGTYTPTGASTRLARMIGKKTCITYGDQNLDSGYANSQTGLGIVQGLGITEEHYEIVGMGHNISHVLRHGDTTVDAIRAFLRQYK